MTEKHEAEKLFEEPVEDRRAEPELTEDRLEVTRRTLWKLYADLEEQGTEALAAYLREKGYAVAKIEADSPTPLQQLLQLAMKANRELREGRSSLHETLDKMTESHGELDEYWRRLLDQEKAARRYDKIYTEQQSEILGEIRELARNTSRLGWKMRLNEIKELAHPLTVFKRYDKVLDGIEEAHEAEEDERG